MNVKPFKTHNGWYYVVDTKVYGPHEIRDRAYLDYRGHLRKLAEDKREEITLKGTKDFPRDDFDGRS